MQNQTESESFVKRERERVREAHLKLKTIVHTILLFCLGRIMAFGKSLLQRELEDSSSDDDDCLIMSAAAIVETYSNKKGRHGGSVLGHKVIYRDREGGHQRMFQDYLADDPTYGPNLFRRRFVRIHS